VTGPGRSSGMINWSSLPALADPYYKLGHQRGSDRPLKLHFNLQILQSMTLLALGASRLPPPMTINRVMGVQALHKVPIREMSVQANTSSVGQMYAGS
jgi:hypothetical protein